MALKLKWENPNVVTTRTTIYRGDAPLNPNSLPTPRVTLEAGVNEWIDNDVKFGSTYYYILGSKTDNDEVLTANQKVLVADNRGVGSSTLLVGNDNLGYYGQVLSADFVNSSHLLAAAATTSGLPGSQINPIWHKFVRHGKILYMPNMNFGSAAWVNLYAAGFVYGVDANGPPDANLTGLTPVNQNRLINFKGNKYRVRLMRGVSDKPLTQELWNNLKTYVEQIEPFEDNEFNDLFFPLVWPVPLKTQRFENITDELPDNWLYPVYNSYDNVNNALLTQQGRIWCQERIPSATAAGATALTRGQRSVTNGGNSNPYTVDHVTYLAGVAGNLTCIWVPILELVEESVVVNKG